MKLADIEQFDLIEAMRQWFVRRRRARLAEELRDHATYIVFKGLAERKRLADCEKQARATFGIIFGEKFEDMQPWQRQLVYDALAARDAGYDIALDLPLRRF